MLAILLPAPLFGALKFLLMLAALLFWGLMILPGVLLKLLPHRPLQRWASRYSVAVAEHWVGTNAVIYRLLQPMQQRVELSGTLHPQRNYLLVCNHQSWADILILVDVLHGRTPFPRFFLKQELKYLPIVGQACWAMDFPFMKRHSHDAVSANPQLRAEDLEATRRACAVFKTEPVTVVNFVEGTRFSEAKRIEKRSPYRYLLRPKSAGLAFTLNAMGEQFAGIVDVTIAYRPTQRPLLWSWLCGEQDSVCVQADVLPVPEELLEGDYEADPQHRMRVQAWLNTLWARKDARLGRLSAEHTPMAPHAAHG